MIRSTVARSRSTSSSPSPTTPRRSASRRRRARASRAARAVVDRMAAGDAPVYGINTGFGSFADVQIPRDALERAAGEPAAQPRGRRRRAAAGPRRARDDGAARQRARQGLLRHPARDARGAARAAEPRRAPGRAVPRLGRRQRRPRAARAPRARAHRRRRSAWDGGARDARARRRSRAAGLAPVALGAEGRARAHQRHAGRRRRCSRWRSPAPSAWRAPPTSPPRCRSTRLRGSVQPVRAAHPRARGRSPARRRRPPTSRALLERQRASTRRTPTAAASRTPIRCAAPPQVHGAAREALALRPRASSTIEANAATDNPMVFADAGDIVSGGNFHGAPVAMAADLLAIARRAAGHDQRAAHRSARRTRR